MSMLITCQGCCLLLYIFLSIKGELEAQVFHHHPRKSSRFFIYLTKEKAEWEEDKKKTNDEEGTKAQARFCIPRGGENLLLLL